MFDNLISFFLIAGFGVFFQWKKPGDINPDVARHVINTTVIRFFLPILCFKVMATASIDKNTVLLPLAAMITIFFAILISFITYTMVGKIATLHKEEKGALILGSSFGNVTFLGLLFLTSLYGQSAAKYVLLYDLLATTPLLFLAGSAIAAYYGRGQKLTIKENFKVVAELPPIWTLVAGFAVNFSGITLPSFLLTTLELMSIPIAPLMIFSIGLALSFPKLKHAIIAMPAVIIKLCVAPIISFGLARFFGMDGLALKSVVMESAMPTMALTLVLSSQHKLDHNLSSFLIIFTTTVALITLPLTARLVSVF
ncbi:MAG: AEC family transporter [Endomicrobium sp.]|nr:AEC family transporter [Endomicrobium sp.]